MMHVLYTGVTMTGKTTLMRIVARELAKSGHAGAVYDPTGTATAGGGWPPNWPMYSDPDDFLDWIESDKCKGPIHVFIDEADEIFGHEMKWNFWLLKKGRHLGIFCHIGTQRPKMVAPTVRGQCGRCYMFRLAAEDSSEIGRDYGHSGLDKINLDRGDFLVLNSGSSAMSQGNVFKLAEGK